MECSFICLTAENSTGKRKGRAFLYSRSLLLVLSPFLKYIVQILITFSKSYLFISPAMRTHEQHRAPAVVSGGGERGGLYWTAGNRLDGADRSCSLGSEPDLAAMVSDFQESSSVGGGAEPWNSSDSDSGFSDLALRSDKISMYKKSLDLYEGDLTVVVHSVILSMTESCHIFSETCNASCIRCYLVKVLQSCGYDAALCATKWQGYGNIPRGEHEYIEVISHGND